MRWSAVILSLVCPGMGHTAIGRPVAGLLFSVVFCLGVLLTLGIGIGLDAPSLNAVFVISLAGTLAFYALCQVSLVAMLLRSRINASSPAKESYLRAGMLAAARGDDAHAEEQFLAALALDCTDVETHLNVAAVYARQGKVRRARRHLGRCRRYDVDGKWAWEVSRELERVENRAQNGAVRMALAEKEE